MENVVNTGGKIKNLRWIGLCLVFFMTFISNIDRANFGVCTSVIMQELSLTPIQMGFITSGFSLAYAAFQIPGSLWVQKYGTRNVVAIAITFWSLFTLTTGLAAGFMTLLLSRIFFGFGEAPLYPGMNKYIFHWFPVQERGFANAMPNAGSFLSLIIAPPAIVFLLQTFGWRAVFFICAALGLIGAALWHHFTRNTPEEHSKITDEECKYISENRQVAVTGKSVPWSKMFKFRSFWCIGALYFCSTFMLQYFVYWLPLFLQLQLHMDIKTMGNAAVLPWTFIFIATMLVGKISDTLMKHGCSLLVSRNALILIAFTCSAISMYVGTTMTDAWSVVICLSIALGFVGFSQTIPWAIASDIGGEYTGVVSSWMNTWGQVGAAVMATGTAWIGSTYGWNYTLFALIAVACIGIVSCLLINPKQKLNA